MNAIAFSLYGKAPKYVQGAIRNVELAPQIYPGWKVVVYCASKVPPAAIDRLTELNCEVWTGPYWLKNPMMWRFLANDDPKFEYFISRDADSRLNLREKAAVDEWLASGKSAHIMRDHPHHNVVMNGGMFGLKVGVIPSMKKLIQDWGRVTEDYGNDQQFLRQAVYPLIANSLLTHDPFHMEHFRDGLAFPISHEPRFRFVGEVFDEREQPRTFDWEMRMNHVYQR